MNRFFRTLVLFTLASLVAACVKEPLPNPLDPETELDQNEVLGSGSFQIWLTDSPTDLAEVNVEILEVQIRACTTEKDDDDSEDQTCDWLPLNTNQGIYNLLDLQDGVDTLLAEIDSLPFDYVREIRLVLGTQNFVVTESGDSIRLKTPSGGTSGLKIKACIDLSMDIDVFEILLDFDAHKSIKELGNGEYLLKPVIKLMDPDRYCGENRDDDDDDEEEDDDEDEDRPNKDLPNTVKETIRETFVDVDEIYSTIDCDSTEGFLVYGEVASDEDDDEDALAFISTDGKLKDVAIEIDEDDLPQAVKETLEKLETDGYDLEDDDLYQLLDAPALFWGIAEAEQEGQLYWFAIDEQGEILCQVPLTNTNHDPYNEKDDDEKDDDEKDDDEKDDDQDDDDQDDKDDDDKDDDDLGMGVPFGQLPDPVKEKIGDLFEDYEPFAATGTDCDGREGFFIGGEVRSDDDEEDAIAFISQEGELIALALEEDEDDLPDEVKEALEKLEEEGLEIEDDDLYKVREASVYWGLAEPQNGDPYYLVAINEKGEVICKIVLEL